MYPELITIRIPGFGPLTVTSFGVMMAAAFLVGIWLVHLELKRRRLDENLAGDILLGAVVGGILGAKLYYVLLNWPLTVQDPLGMLLSRAGLVWYGGFLGGAAGVIWAIRRRGAPVPATLDACAPALAMAYGVGRIGCFLVGDDYGRPTDSWVGIAFPNGAPPSTAGYLRRSFGVAVPDSIPDQAVLAVHPTQLYEIGMALVMFAVLWRLRTRRWAAGRLFALWMILAGAERFIVEFFRAKDDRFFGFLTLAQVISIVLLLAGAALFARLAGREPEPAPAKG
ncbi:MAG: prolipoprotein diacylglyceryl transferase [Gemmatimonadota bacterium]|nr:prolipoprotein diacylglyceryl transferase [Gemmatimonadota bacterium]